MSKVVVVPGDRLIRWSRVRVAAAMVMAVVAKCVPRQLRGPPPKGMKAYLGRGVSGRSIQRSGSKAAGRS